MLRRGAVRQLTGSRLACTGPWVRSSALQGLPGGTEHACGILPPANTDALKPSVTAQTAEFEERPWEEGKVGGREQPLCTPSAFFIPFSCSRGGSLVSPGPRSHPGAGSSLKPCSCHRTTGPC